MLFPSISVAGSQYVVRQRLTTIGFRKKQEETEMSKRRIAWQALSTLLVALLLLTACQKEGPAAGEPREIVWMVRTGPSENPWEQDIIIPAFEKEYPDIKVNLLILDQPDIALKREAMIAAGEPLHVWSTNWGGDGFASDRSRGLIMDLTPSSKRTTWT